MVLLFSIIFPLVKILLLLEISLLGLMKNQHKVFTYRMMEFVGKWGMMDVMLLAFMVMLVKLGSMVHFSFGPAAWAFVLAAVLVFLQLWMVYTVGLEDAAVDGRRFPVRTSAGC